MTHTGLNGEKPSITKIAIWLSKLTEQERQTDIISLVQQYQNSTGKPATKDFMYRAWREADLPEGPRAHITSGTDRIYHLSKAILEIADALDLKLSGRDVISRFVTQKHPPRNSQ